VSSSVDFELELELVMDFELELELVMADRALVLQAAWRPSSPSHTCMLATSLPCSTKGKEPEPPPSVSLTRSLSIPLCSLSVEQELHHCYCWHCSSPPLRGAVASCATSCALPCAARSFFAGCRAHSATAAAVLADAPQPIAGAHARQSRLAYSHAAACLGAVGIPPWEPAMASPPSCPCLPKPSVPCFCARKVEEGGRKRIRNSSLGPVAKYMTHVNSACRDLFAGIFIGGKYRDLEEKMLFFFGFIFFFCRKKAETLKIHSNS